MSTELPSCDVAIIGGGPAGVAAALELRQRGHSVTILEREAELGGVPRHCAHSPFGMREFGRVLFGPAYARRLAVEARAARVDILLRHSVTALQPGGQLNITTPDGTSSLSAKRVLLATGAREAPRSARLISGGRPIGVITTGTLQQAINLEGLRPMRRALVVGTELVSFSALLTCRSGGINPIAMVDENPRLVARSVLGVYPWITGVPLHLGAKITDIHGRPRVEGVTLQRVDGTSFDISCDGIVLSGHFTAEGSLALCSHIDVDPGTGGPVVDQYARCSDPAYFAAGNMLHPVETGGWCFREGRQIGGLISDDLAGRLPAAGGATRIVAGAGIRYVLPQRITPAGPGGFGDFQLRVKEPLKSGIVMQHSGVSLWTRRRGLLPERRILAPLTAATGIRAGSDIIVQANED